VASALKSAAAPVNTTSTFWKAGIQLGIADGNLVCQITPKSARCLRAPLHLAVEAYPEAEADDEETKAQLCLEQVVADVAALSDEFQQRLISETV
jgi:hypothetical protein